MYSKGEGSAHKHTHNTAVPANSQTWLPNTMSQVGWMVGTKEKQPVLFVYVNQKKKKNERRKSIFMYWYCSYTDKRTENRVSRGCQKTESKQGKTAGERGNRWTLSCHAEEFICVFYLVECGVVARRLRPQLWQPLHLPGGFEWHWFCFDCVMVHEIGDGLLMMILSYQDYCGISQWWELACLVMKG